MVGNTKPPQPHELMIVNETPGEECRIAILEDGHLEELYTENAATATNVNNIYKGRVTNVEPAIQAAFVDYGRGQSGFLHISDLHPRYFPGGDKTERVGKKIPRKHRPPIQQCLKRGDEVLVQVLKEGIGTKGPTLTSYLSIPGRMLVMMPEMDRVGVSRKLEDPGERREMREILDQLELPEGFGFILRTEGFGKSKTELNRDLAYLTRLWKTMEGRIKNVGAPCELYRESDLFIRTIRDVLRPSIGAIVVDSETLYERAQNLLRVVVPRSAPKLILYREKVPIFHAFDIERQIELIHSREVPLPSGGMLVIEQTEALVAIDVNSGRSRKATDSETNAYNTNCEAVDEICRQLRLRDLGGVVINDLIDMHKAQHRRSIEDRFREGLTRDRAKTTMLRISEFGVVELTRQRMRPSMQKAHFMECPQCHGRGDIKTPTSVGADAVRQVSYLLQFDRVRRVELACSTRVASVLLSGKRRELVSLEDSTRKRVDVVVKDTLPQDRVDLYAYDERNADIDVARLPTPPKPSLEKLESAMSLPRPAEAAPLSEEASGRKRRRRRGGGRSAPASADLLGVEDGLPPLDFEDVFVHELPEHDLAQEPDLEPELEQPELQPELAPLGDGKPIRIHALAHELGVASKEVLEVAKTSEGSKVTTASSSVAAKVAELIRRRFLGKKKAPPPAPPAEAVPPRAPGAAPAPAPATHVPRPTHAAHSTPTRGAPDAVTTEPGALTPAQKRRRRRRRRGGSRGATEAVAQGAADSGDAPMFDRADAPGRSDAPGRGDRTDLPDTAGAAESGADGSERGGRRRRRRRRRGRGGRGGDGNGPGPERASVAETAVRTQHGANGSAGEALTVVTTAATAATSAARPKKGRRSLYGSSRRTIGADVRPTSPDDDR